MQKTLKSFVLCAALSLALVANAAPGLRISTRAAPSHYRRSVLTTYTR